MKHAVFLLMIVALILGPVGCDQAQRALDTVDKANSVKGDIEKKAKEVNEKLRGLISGSGGKGSGDEEKESGTGKDD